MDCSKFTSKTNKKKFHSINESRLHLCICAWLSYINTCWKYAVNISLYWLNGIGLSLILHFSWRESRRLQEALLLLAASSRKWNNWCFQPLSDIAVVVRCIRLMIFERELSNALTTEADAAPMRVGWIRIRNTLTFSVIILMTCCRISQILLSFITVFLVLFEQRRKCWYLKFLLPEM